MDLLSAIWYFLHHILQFTRPRKVKVCLQDQNYQQINLDNGIIYTYSKEEKEQICPKLEWVNDEQ